LPTPAIKKAELPVGFSAAEAVQPSSRARCTIRRVNGAWLIAIQAAGFVLVGGLSLWHMAGRGARVVRAVLAAGLAAGACQHVVMLIERGPVSLPDQPVAFNAFWTSLAVLDPLAALLLNYRPRAGILLTLAIMIADVSVNVRAFARFGLLSPANVGLWMQAVFGLFALVMARRIWAAGSVRRDRALDPPSAAADHVR
jgi:hypothetical protein